MLVDLLLNDNYIVINIKVAQIFGLDGAVYISQLINIYHKALKKNKVENNYFKVDRKYISEKTTLCLNDQLVVDQNLIKLNVLTKHSDDPNIIKLDENLLLSIINSDDNKLLEGIQLKAKIKSPKGVKESQRQIIINNLKNSIICSNYELLTALRDWVDAIYSKPTGYLSKTAINTFQTTLNNYTQGDLDLALKIVQIASIQGYKDCQWAINAYEKDKTFNSTRIRTTVQKTASVDTVNNNISF